MPKTEKKTANEKKGLDAAVIVAVIGLFSALTVGVLNSSLIAKLLDRAFAPSAPTETSPAPSDGSLIFNQNFEDNVASGFAFETGKWEVVKENANFVLKGVATETTQPAATAYFSSNDFSDGLVEFRVKFLKQPDLYLDFHVQDNVGSYVLDLSPKLQSVALATNTFENNDWKWAPVSSNSELLFTFQQDVWYKMQLKMQGEKLILNIDGNQILSASDSRFTRGRLRFALDPNAAIELDDVKVWSTAP
jgi:hypothetical protein